MRVGYDGGGSFASRLASLFPQSIIRFICNFVFVIRLVNQAWLNVVDSDQNRNHS